MHGLPMKFVICVLALLYAACTQSGPMTRRSIVKSDSPIVTISAGELELSSINSHEVYYLIDRRTRICSIFIESNSNFEFTQIPCCSLFNYSLAKPYLTWLNDASCSQ